MTRKLLTALFLTTLALPCSVVQADKRKDVPFAKCDSGNDTDHNFRESALKIARNQAQYGKIQKLIGSKRKYISIDFDKEIILFVFAGKKSTGGYRVEIDRVSTPHPNNKKDDIVEATTYSPEPYSLNIFAITSPWVQVKIKRSDLEHGGKEKFELWLREYKWKTKWESKP